MNAFPTIETARLHLRRVVPGDAVTVQRLAGDPAIAATTIRIPHPYPDGEAERWMASHADAWAERTGLTLAITVRGDETFIGATDMRIDEAFSNAEIGYWIGVPWQGNGFATEAARAMMHFCFHHLNLHRVHAHAMSGNPASCRVLEKAGMRHEGALRDHIRKDDRFHDAVLYGILRTEYDMHAHADIVVR